jgi:hypothetical protein
MMTPLPKRQRQRQAWMQVPERAYGRQYDSLGTARHFSSIRYRFTMQPASRPPASLDRHLSNQKSLDEEKAKV